MTKEDDTRLDADLLASFDQRGRVVVRTLLWVMDDINEALRRNGHQGRVIGFREDGRTVTVEVTGSVSAAEAIRSLFLRWLRRDLTHDRIDQVVIVGTGEGMGAYRIPARSPEIEPSAAGGRTTRWHRLTERKEPDP